MSVARVALELDLDESGKAERLQQTSGEAFDLRIVNCLDEAARTAEVGWILTCAAARSSKKATC
jgi:hypothetical protein